MKLHLPKIMDALERKEILAGLPTGMPVPLPVKSKSRQALVQMLLPKMHKAVKYVFDSGSDQDPQQVQVVRETAVNMIEAGLLHLPFPTVWVEDPFDDDPEGARNYYLCSEDAKKNIIEIFFFQSLGRMPEGMPRYVLHLHPAIIDLAVATDAFRLLGADDCAPMQKKTYGEAVYSVKKLLVFLATGDIEREKHEGKPFKASLPKQHRQYPFLVIRPPADTDARNFTGTGRASGAKRRHIVAGYTWGKNTRPLEEQRWIKPFWRGTQEIGEVVHEARVIRTK